MTMAPENRKFILVSAVAAVLFCLFLGLGLGLGQKAFNATRKNSTNTTTMIPGLSFGFLINEY